MRKKPSVANGLADYKVAKVCQVVPVELVRSKSLAASTIRSAAKLQPQIALEEAEVFPDGSRCLSAW